MSSMYAADAPMTPNTEQGTAVSARIALLGVLTIVSYGSWYYGFGVLLGDIGRDLRSPDRTLAFGFGPRMS